MSASGCASTTAKTRSDPAPLAIPEPPPRLIEPLPEVAEMPPPEPERRDPAPPAPRVTRPPRDTQAARPDPKPDPAKPSDLVVVEGPVPSAPRAELRTPETADEEEAARGVRETLDRASKTLARIDYRTLGKEGQEQYNTAKRFMEQAEEALRARNPIAAKYLAEKADTLAKGLTGR
ncbi:MAG: hypothetical protein ACRD1S_09000 [Vicinamibacterales bacterium]